MANNDNPAALKKGTKMSGPIRSLRRASADSLHPYDYTAVGRQATVTVSALAAAAAETYTIADADSLVGDVICVSPDVAVESGWALQKAWVSADGTISVQARNTSAGALTGGSLALYYTITR